MARLARNRVFLGIAVVFLACLAYGNTLGHDFVFDDLKTIRNNTLLRSPQFGRLLFSEEYFVLSGESTFRPLVTVSYYVEHQLFAARPYGYHLTNIALHALNVWLLFSIVSRWFGRPIWGAVAATIWAIHPAGTEAVNGISFREDLLVATLILASWRALSRGAGQACLRHGALGVAAVLFLGACLTKENGLIFPALAVVAARGGLLSDPPGQRLSAYRTLTLIGWLAPAVVLFLWIWGVWMSNPIGAPSAPFGGSRLAAIFNTPMVYGHHVWRLALATGFEAEYFLTPYRDPRAWGAIGGMATLIVAGCLALYCHERAPRIGFGLLWIILTLGPVSNVVPLFNPVADRYLYLPLAGWAMTAAAVAEALWRRAGGWRTAHGQWARRSIAGIGLIATGAMMYATTNRNLVWSDEERLFTDLVEKAPQSWRAQFRLGAIDLERALPAAPSPERSQALARAEGRLLQAKALNPKHTDIRVALGSVFLLTDRVEAAIHEYEVALKLWPKNATACYNLSYAHALRDPPDFERAADYMNQAVDFRYPVPESRREWILEQRGKARAKRPGTIPDDMGTTSTLE